MELKEDIVVEIKQFLYTKYEAIYNNFVKSKVLIPFEVYLTTNINQIVEELATLNELSEEVVNNFKNKRKTTKRRWVTKEIKYEEDNNKKVGFNKIVNLTALLFFDTFKNDENVCLKAYGVKTFEEYKTLKIQELNNWLDDDEKDVNDYPYIQDKKPNVIETLLKGDIKYNFFKQLQEKIASNNNEMITLPNTITNIVFDYTNKLKFDDSQIISKTFNGNTESYLQDVRVLSDTSIMESYLSVTALKEGLLAENVKMLNAFDKSVLTYLMSLQDENFYKTGSMTVRIGDIVKGIGFSNGTKNYNAVKQSIIKMRYIRNEIRDAKLRTIEVRIFNSANIVVEKMEMKNPVLDEKGNELKGKRYMPIEFAQLEFSKDFVMEVVKNATTSVYARIIEQLTLNASQILVYPMQRERLVCWKENPTAKELVLKLNRTFFSRIILFTSNRRDRQIKVINSGLDEIMKSNLIIKRYELVGDIYTIYFYPLSKQEINDLNDNKVPAEILTILENQNIIEYDENNNSGILLDDISDVK